MKFYEPNCLNLNNSFIKYSEKNIYTIFLDVTKIIVFLIFITIILKLLQ